MVNLLLQWLLDLFKELSNPKTVASGLIIVVGAAAIISIFNIGINDYLLPHPILDVECFHLKEENQSFIVFENNGTQSADEVLAQIYFESESSAKLLSETGSQTTFFVDDLGKNSFIENQYPSAYPSKLAGFVPKSLALGSAKYIPPQSYDNINFKYGGRFLVRLWSKNNELVQKTCE